MSDGDKIVTARGDNPGSRNGTESAPPPSWLASLGVKHGRWYIDPKARPERLMKNQFVSPSGRIYAFLSLATMGFQSELAVKLEAGKRVPVTPADVCAAVGIHRNHFRRHMAELEAYGLAECRGTTKGAIEIYSWAIPREISREKIVTVRGDNATLVCDDGAAVPESLVALLKQLRIRGAFVTGRGDIPEIERAAAVTKEAVLSLRAVLERHRVREPHIRKKGTERNSERNKNIAASSSSSVGGPETETQETTTTNLEPLRDALIDACGAAGLDDARFVSEAATRANDGEEVPIDKLAGMVRGIGQLRRKTNRHAPTTPGLVAMLIPAHVETWQKTREEDERAAAKAAGIERAQRISSAARWLQWAAQPEQFHLTVAEVHEITDWIERADAAELAEARALLESDAETRQATG